jgi:transposase InsO family protein
MNGRQWLRVLAYISGLIDQELLLQVEYLAAENRILRAHLQNRLRLTRDERFTLGEIGKRLGRKGLEKVASVARPETVLGWFRKLVAQKFDGSKQRLYPGRPAISPGVASLIVKLARENSGWGYDRISGALANLGHKVSDQTVGNVLRRHGIAPAPKRRQTTAWKDFIASHMAVTAGIDFFTAEVLTWSGLATYHVLFLIHLESRRITIAGTTRHPTEAWMEQMARNVTDASTGCLRDHRYVLHNRDTKFCASFRSILQDGGVHPLRLPARSPNLNAFAERWVRSVKQECLSKLILLGECSLRRVLAEYVTHYHEERNHQGKNNLLLFRAPAPQCPRGTKIFCRQRLGGLLRYYTSAA